MIAPCPPDSTAVSRAATATTVLPLPTSPCSRRRIGFSRRMSARTSSITRSCAPVSPKERSFKNGLSRRPSPLCLAPRSVLSRRALRAARPVWIRNSSWKTSRRMAARRRGLSPGEWVSWAAGGGAGGGAGLDEGQFGEEEPAHGGAQAGFVFGEVDLVDGVVQVREVVAGEGVGGQRAGAGAGGRGVA